MSKNIEVDKKNTDRPYIPKKVDNISLNSLGFLLDKNAAIWRGPMLSSAINQIYEKTNWDELDFLLIDMPPGTGDAYLTVCQKIVPDFVILVSTISITVKTLLLLATPEIFIVSPIFIKLLV